ncbi:MAG TPA: glycosyltransferase [Anaerolineales bacterium]|nr:glycosyltransferase [Anaerolineales bacterium]
MTITFLAGGTRGDVLPYLALGLGLREAGSNVRIAAPIGFKFLIEPTGLTFAPFDGNPSDLLIQQSDPLTIGRSLCSSIQATRKFIHRARGLYPRMLQTAAEACRGSTVIVCGLSTLWGAHIAEYLQVPTLRAVLQPLTPTREFSSVLLPFRFNLLGIGNRLSHWIMLQAIWLSFHPEINHTRRTHFGLPRAPWLDPALRPFSDQPITLHGFSEHIIPRPKDWNEKQIITGYWRSPSPQWTPPKELVQFIERSPRNTVAIGLGSPGTKDFPHVLRIIEQALIQADARAVLTIPSFYHMHIKSERIFPIEYTPHEWLYQHVRVAVHHGGAGTTAAGLHAGIPTVTLPQGIDQFFWGERVYKIGVGTQPIPQRTLNAKKLASALREALWNESMQERAKRLSVALNLENGIRAAVRVMRQVM